MKEGITKTELKRQKKRNDLLDSIQLNEAITHCYIRKNGSYYRPNSCGYTDYLTRAGVYTKKEAIQSARNCDDLMLIPVKISDHNDMINTEIKELQSRLI